MEQTFITYLRTKQLLNHRLRGQAEGVKLTEHDKKRFNVTNEDLHQLITIGAIQSTPEGYKVIIPGTIDLSLVKRAGATQTDLHRWMKNVLLNVDLQTETIPEYFSLFLKSRNEYLDLFYTVDTFSGRVHTPVSSLHRELRPELLLLGEAVVSLDVSQMQPTLLAKILIDEIGSNSFTNAIYSGGDIYLMIQQAAGLKTRDEAKKRFYELIFGYPSQELKTLFTDSDWLIWVNRYKSTSEPLNPHSDRAHTNLAWKLQTSEVAVMSEIWQTLAEHGIPFLTIHDEIIVRDSDSVAAAEIMINQLTRFFNKNFYSHIK